MRKDVAIRRVVHGLVALAPLYYLIPSEVPGIGVGRWVLLVCFLLTITAFETVRLSKGWSFLGLRPHEKRSIASFAWAAGGITIALWVFPPAIASAALVGMAIVDPVAGELRQRWPDHVASVIAPSAAYFTISFSILTVFEEFDPIGVSALAAAGTVSAILFERMKFPHVDDDFLMIVVPGALMSGLSLTM